MIRCKWCNLKNEKYIEYHDKEWGVPVYDDKHLYEMLILESFQAGLSWECVLNKREDVIKACDNFEKHLASVGQNCRAGQPTPGNKAGGLSTLEEKSLGCIRKGGSRPIVEVLEEAERPTKKGAIIMDTPGYDIASVTSMRLLSSSDNEYPLSDFSNKSVLSNLV